MLWRDNEFDMIIVDEINQYSFVFQPGTANNNCQCVVFELKYTPKELSFCYCHPVKTMYRLRIATFDFPGEIIVFWKHFAQKKKTYHQCFPVNPPYHLKNIWFSQTKLGGYGCWILSSLR
jgi:hypothetical protein